MKKQKPEKFNVLNFLKESRKYIYLATGPFFFAFLIGFLVNVPAEVETKILDMLRELVSKFDGLNTWQTVWAIFSNNLMVSFLVLILGVLIGIPSVWLALSNGFLVGFVAKFAVQQEGILILWRLLPHGIFELPAVLISIGLGIKIGFEWISVENSFLRNVKNSLKTFIYLILPLLIIAAIIEGLLISFIG